MRRMTMMTTSTTARVIKDDKDATRSVVNLASGDDDDLEQ